MIGARLFEPELEKNGNLNTGKNLKLITQFPEKTAQILDCSEELLFLLPELLRMIESIKAQDADVKEILSKRIFDIFQKYVGEFSQLFPPIHRLLAHFVEFVRYYHYHAIGELSESAQGAINAQTKKDVSSFSLRGSHQKHNFG